MVSLELRFKILLIAGFMLPGSIFADCAADIAEMGVTAHAVSNFESKFLKALADSSLAQAIERVEKKVEGYKLPKALSDAVVREITDHLSRKISRAISSAQMDFVIRQAKVLAEQNQIEVSDEFLQQAIAENNSWKKLVMQLFEPDQTPAEKRIASFNVSKYLQNLITGEGLLLEDRKKEIELFAGTLAGRLGDERKKLITRSTIDVLANVEIDRLIIDQGLPYLKSMREQLEGQSEELSNRYLLSLYNRVSSYVREGLEDESEAYEMIEEAMTKATAVFVEKIIEDIASNGLSIDKTKANEMQRNRIISYVVRMTELDRFIVSRYFPKLTAASSQIPEQKRDSFEPILYPLTRAFKDKAVRYTRNGRRSWSDARDFFDDQASITVSELFSRPAPVIDFPDLIQDQASIIEYILGEIQMKEDLGLDFANSELDMTQWATAVRLWPSFSQHLLAMVFADEGSYEDGIEIFEDASAGFLKAIKDEPIDQLVEMNREVGSAFVAKAKSKGFFEYDYRAVNRVLPREFESRMHLLNQEQQQALRIHFPIVSSYLSKRVAWVSKGEAQDLIVFQMELIDQIFKIWPDVVKDLKSRNLSGPKKAYRSEMRDSLYALSSMTKTEMAEIGVPFLSFRNSLSSESQKLLFESLLLKLQTNFISDIGPAKTAKELNDAKTRFNEWFQEGIISDAVGIRLEKDGSFIRRRTVLSTMAAEIRRDWVQSQSQQNVREEVQTLVQDEIGNLIKRSAEQETEESSAKPKQDFLAVKESPKLKTDKEKDTEKVSLAIAADNAAAPLWDLYFRSESGPNLEKPVSSEDLFKVYRDWLQSLSDHFYRRFHGEQSGFDKEDFFSFAYFGFSNAVARYEQEVGRFTVYAFSRIRGAILDALRENNFVPRLVLKRSGIVGKVEEKFLKQNGYMPTSEELPLLVREYLINEGKLGALAIDREVEKIIRDGANQTKVSELDTDYSDEAKYGYDGRDRALSREPQADEKITREFFWNYIKKDFDARKREVIRLSYQEGLGVKEVASIMGLSTSGIGNFKREIISTLKGRFSRLSNEELEALLSN